MAAAGEGGASGLRGRAGAALALLVLFFGGYYGIAAGVAPDRAHSLRTSLDDRIPFVGQAIYLYAWVYTALFFPLFVVRSQALFRRTLVAYALVVAASLLCFAAYPVTAIGFRPDLAALDPRRFTGWALRLNYFLDPPYNLFPSVHLAAVTLAALVSFKARPIYGALAFLGVAGVAVSVSATKQHFVLDSAAGVALAIVAYAAVVRPYRPRPGEVLAFGWWGPAAYLAIHAGFHLLAYSAYCAGFEPWG